MARSENGRRGRKLKAAKNTDAEQAEDQVEVVAPPKARKTRSSSKRRSRKEKGSRGSRNSQPVENVAFMAEGDDDEEVERQGAADTMNAINKQSSEGEDGEAPPPLSDEQQAEVNAIDQAVEEGEFKTEFINADKDDIAKIAERQYSQTSINARGRIHDFCDQCEDMAMAMLTDALVNKGNRENVLQARMDLLLNLWLFRDLSDCEDDFSIEEFQGEMRLLATIQKKLGGLDSKISALMMGADDDSSDTDGEGEAANLSQLKNARQNLRYALGDSMPGFC